MNSRWRPYGTGAGAWVVSLVVAASITAGCFSVVTQNSYAPPILPPPPNEMVVAESFDRVWDRLVGELAKSFYVINNVEKVSRIINVSFSSDSPRAFADCGQRTRVSGVGKRVEEHVYNVADSNSYTLTQKWGVYNNLPSVSRVTRRARLEGRANIYVAPRDSGTVVSVNARFTLSVAATGVTEFYNAFGQIQSTQPIDEAPSSVTFDTRQAGSADWGKAGVPSPITCMSTGHLEGSILAMATANVR